MWDDTFHLLVLMAMAMVGLFWLLTNDWTSDFNPRKEIDRLRAENARLREQIYQHVTGLHRLPDRIREDCRDAA